MQFRLGPSRSILLNCPDKLRPLLCKNFTYTNTSVQYQVFMHKKNRSKIINRLARTVAMNEVEAKSMWQETFDELNSNMKVSLLDVAPPENYIVFPTGLLNKILQFFSQNGFDQEGMEKNCIVDLRTRPKQTAGFPIFTEAAKLRPYQQRAVTELLNSGQGSFVGATGCGKTVCIQELIRNIGLKTVLIVPTISILTQTVKRFEKYFGRGAISQMGGGKVFKGPKKITVACAASMAKADPEMFKDVDVLCFDEMHHCPATTLQKICFKVLPHAFYRFGFSATNFRNDGADLAIEAATYPAVFEYDFEDGIREGFLAQPSTIIYNVPFNTYRSYGGDLLTYAYKYHVFRNRDLNIQIIQQIQSYLDAGKQVLILVREIEHGCILQAQLPGAAFVHSGKRASKFGPAPEPKYKKATDAVNDFNSGKVRCLIGTSIIGEGSDILPVDVLFNLMGGKSKLELMQNVGRGLRKTETKDKVLIIDYIHSTHKVLKKHSILRANFYKTLGHVELRNLSRYNRK